jgi:hypothetical protein
MASQLLKPQFFVTRQNGAMVPMIAVDELPIHVQLQGVSRNLSSIEVAGMTAVGVVEARHQFYTVENMNNTKPISLVQTPITPCSTPISPTASQAPAPRKASVVDPNQANDVSPLVQQQRTPLDEPLQPSSGSDQSCNVSDASGSDEPSSRATSPDANAPTTIDLKASATTKQVPLEWRSNANNPSATGAAVKHNAFTDKIFPEVDWDPEMPTPGQKIYCAHWLKYGECSFTQTGCLFKHIMPLKLEVLEALGLRDLPDWFRKTVHCGSLRVNGGRNGLSFGIVPKNIGKLDGPRARVNTEATRRAIASHINAMPMPGSRPPFIRARDRAPRPMNINKARVPRAAPTDAEKALEKALERERHDRRMAAAFEADLDSNACTDMVDEEMERIRAKEQAEWEEEQRTRQAATAAHQTTNEKRPISSSSESIGKEEKKKPGPAGGNGGRVGAFRRSPPRRQVLTQ